MSDTLHTSPNPSVINTLSKYSQPNLADHTPDFLHHLDPFKSFSFLTPSLAFLSTTLPSHETKILCYHFLALHMMIRQYHCLQNQTTYRIYLSCTMTHLQPVSNLPCDYNWTLVCWYLLMWTNAQWTFDTFPQLPVNRRNELQLPTYFPLIDILQIKHPHATI